MNLEIHSNQSNPASRAENYLRQQPGVVEAHAWETKGAILAKVILIDDNNFSGQDLQLSCRKALGAKNAPRMIMIELIQKPRVGAVA